jgi:hypothetical protein
MHVPLRPGAEGIYPSGTLARTLQRRSPTKPDYTATSAWGSGARPSLEAPDLRQHSNLALRSYTANDTSQGPGKRRHAPSYRGSPALPLGHDIAATFPTRSRTGRDTRRQSFPAASRGSEAPGPMRQPLEPTSFTAKKTPEGPPGGGRCKLTQPDTQSVITEQPDDAQGFFGSTTRPHSMVHCCKALLDSGACRP